MQIKITEISQRHDLVIITTNKGYSYACTWAKGDNPLTNDEVKQAWKNDRKAFEKWYGRLN